MSVLPIHPVDVDLESAYQPVDPAGDEFDNDGNVALFVRVAPTASDAATLSFANQRRCTFDSPEPALADPHPDKPLVVAIGTEVKGFGAFSKYRYNVPAGQASAGRVKVTYSGSDLANAEVAAVRRAP